MGEKRLEKVIRFSKWAATLCFDIRRCEIKLIFRGRPGGVSDPSSFVNLGRGSRSATFFRWSANYFVYQEIILTTMLRMYL